MPWLSLLFFLLVFVGLVWLSVRIVIEMRLNQSQRAFLDAVTEPETAAQIRKLGMEVRPGDASEYAAFVTRETARFQETIGALFEQGKPK